MRFKYLVMVLIGMFPIFGPAIGQVATTGCLPIIPQPLYCNIGTGNFQWRPSSTLYIAPKFKAISGLINEEIQIFQTASNKTATICINFESKLKEEEYDFRITPTRITIKASSIKGAIHGVFTLIQLIKLQKDQTILPCVEIKDSPRFAYRGMHLDVSRNFYTIDFIKKMIHLMAVYKFNNFHWHLTDSPGWRIEIDKYPGLTQQAAFRTHKDWLSWTKNGSKFLQMGRPDAFGGYYTKNEIKEVVQYAAERGINVIPEIEIPGHSYAALSAYPSLSCSEKPHTNHEFCIGNPNTFSFFEDILTEIMEMFPSKYIHIGGDEAGTGAWKKCPKCQEKMKANNLKEEHELQDMLINHVTAFLQKNGRMAIGWDEIFKGKKLNNATIMSWRGEEPGVKAAMQLNEVIMTPGVTYLDAYQSNPTTQPLAIGGYLPLQRVYNYEPIPKNILGSQYEKYIKGSQGNLWTEYMPNSEHVEYMAFPRALAIAELTWTDKSKKNYNDFLFRLQLHYLLLQRYRVNYFRPSTHLDFKERHDLINHRHFVEINSEYFNPEIRYTLDGSEPDTSSELYQQPLNIEGNKRIKAAIYSEGRKMGQTSTYEANNHKAIGKKVTFITPWSDSYPAKKEATMTNGNRGSFTYGDSEWLGYLKDFEAVVDMDSIQPLREVAITFMQQKGPGVFLPKYVEVYTSSDSSVFERQCRIEHNISPDDPALQFYNFKCTLKNDAKVRYIKIVAPNIHGGFMFTDEVIIY
jgi:hexosaminidase